MPVVPASDLLSTLTENIETRSRRVKVWLILISFIDWTMDGMLGISIYLSVILAARTEHSREEYDANRTSLCRESMVHVVTNPFDELV